MSPLFYTLGHTFLNCDSLLCLPPLRNQEHPTFSPMLWTCHPQAWNLPPPLKSVIREPPLCHMGLHSPQSPWHGVCLSMALKPQLTSEAVVCLNAINNWIILTQKTIYFSVPLEHPNWSLLMTNRIQRWTGQSFILCYPPISHFLLSCSVFDFFF